MFVINCVLIEYIPLKCLIKQKKSQVTEQYTPMHIEFFSNQCYNLIANVTITLVIKLNLINNA